LNGAASRRAAPFGRFKVARSSRYRSRIASYPRIAYPRVPEGASAPPFPGRRGCDGDGTQESEGRGHDSGGALGEDSGGLRAGGPAAGRTLREKPRPHYRGRGADLLPAREGRQKIHQGDDDHRPARNQVLLREDPRDPAGLLEDPPEPGMDLPRPGPGRGGHGHGEAPAPEERRSWRHPRPLRPREAPRRPGRILRRPAHLAEGPRTPPTHSLRLLAKRRAPPAENPRDPLAPGTPPAQSAARGTRGRRDTATGLP